MNRLAGYLREQGLNVWMDETDIHGATMWTEEIVEAIHGCTLFILAISSHSTGSKNVVKELALASEREKKILPLYLEESQIPKNMEYQLAGIQNIALYTLDKAKAYEFVHQTIRRLGVGQTQTGRPSAWPSVGRDSHPGPRHGPHAAAQGQRQRRQMGRHRRRCGSLGRGRALPGQRRRGCACKLLRHPHRRLPRAHRLQPMAPTELPFCRLR